MTEPIDIITVSREVGAGGSDVARALGERLGWPVLDRDMISLVGERVGLREEVVETLDEHPGGWGRRLAEAMRMVVPAESPLIPYTGDLPNTDVVAAAAAAVITEAAERPPLVIVGHGAQCLLHNRPHTFHIRLVAPIAERVQRLQARFGWDPAQALAEARRYDADRRAYVTRYYKRSWDDPTLYDVQINTGAITLEEAAAFVVSLVERRGAVR